MWADYTQLHLQPDELPSLNHGSICYLVGAGLTKAAYGIPTSRGFLKRQVHAFTDGEVKPVKIVSHPDERTAPHDHVDPYLPGLLDRIEKEYGELESVNVEMVMTDLHVRSFGIARTWETSGYDGSPSRPIPELRRDYDLLIHYIRKRLSVIRDDTPPRPLLTEFVKGIRNKDSLVTLNYDVGIERHLHEAQTRDHNQRLQFLEESLTPTEQHAGNPTKTMDAIARPTPEKGIITKLHGSRDWFTCPNASCLNRYYIQPMAPWYPQWKVASDHQRLTLRRCRHCGSWLQPVIIPPTSGKAFDDFPKLGVMWAQAFEAFRHADRWVFLGVSLADTDFHLSSFFRSLTGAPDANYQICIVNPDYESVAQRLFRSMAPRMSNEFTFKANSARMFVFEDIDEYLKAAAESDRRS